MTLVRWVRVRWRALRFEVRLMREAHGADQEIELPPGLGAFIRETSRELSELIEAQR